MSNNVECRDNIKDEHLCFGLTTTTTAVTTAKAATTTTAITIAKAATTTTTTTYSPMTRPKTTIALALLLNLLLNIGAIAVQKTMAIS